MDLKKILLLDLQGVGYFLCDLEIATADLHVIERSIKS